MKRISSIIFILFIFNLSLVAAEIKGIIKVENHDDFGVFIYVENELKYDISDQQGNFSIDGLDRGKEYVLVFQKGELPDYKKTVKVEDETTEVIIEMLDVRRDIRYPIRGQINSKLQNDIFVDLNDESYGIIVKPNQKFNTNLLEGGYKATLIQEGAYKKNVEFLVEKGKTNDMGTHSMEAIDYNTLTLRFDERLKDGVILLYKDDYLVHSERIKSGTQNLIIEPLKSGLYTLKVKAYGKKDYISNVEVVRNSVRDIKLQQLSKFDTIYVNIEPKDVAATVKIYHDGNIIEEMAEVKDLAIFESLDYNKQYDIVVSASKYKNYSIKRAQVGDKLEANLARDVKGSLITGYIYPFNSNATVMLLDQNKILAKAKMDETGYYELETVKAVSGRKIIRVKADGFEENTVIQTIEKGTKASNFNLELIPKISRVSGKVTLNSKYTSPNVLVYIEELAIWQYTNEKGEYYFKNIPNGKYSLIFKKLGYQSIMEKITVKQGENVTKNSNLVPMGKMVFRSNLENYTLKLNGRKEDIKTKLHEKIEGLGLKTIVAEKPGYLTVRTQIKLTEAGEIRDINIEFISIEKQNKLVRDKIDVIRDLIANLEIAEAERVLYDLSKVKQLKSYEQEYRSIKNDLKKAKATLFGIDRGIKLEIEKIKSNMFAAEDTDVGYLEKQRYLRKVYQQSIDRLEKVVLVHPYTTYRTDILNLQGDIFTKLGMINNSKSSYQEAKKYINRRN